MDQDLSISDLQTKVATKKSSGHKFQDVPSAIAIPLSTSLPVRCDQTSSPEIAFKEYVFPSSELKKSGYFRKSKNEDKMMQQIMQFSRLKLLDAFGTPKSCKESSGSKFSYRPLPWIRNDYGGLF